MKDKRTRTTMQQVLKDIAPYTTKTMFGKMSIKEESIKPVAILLLNQYSNVKLSQGVSSKREGCPWMKISVKGILLSEEKTLDIIVSNKTKKARKSQMEEATFDEMALFLTAMEDD
ncbi:MAG: hypothetical protein LUD41_02810 [Phascolarctobacterium sp.]|nr:hypothetical protein [Phascolarctobacterium sp.]